METLYLGAGLTLGSAAHLAQLGWAICSLTPWASTTGNECLALSHLCGFAARYAFAEVFKGISSPAESFLSKGVPHSQRSWYFNQMLLTQIPAFTQKEKELLLFLQKRWLSRSSGIFSLLADLICPCFGISVQVHPATSGGYMRDPCQKFSQTYTNTVESWKQALPHPLHFPLVLTRPFDLQEYLPHYVKASPDERVEIIVEKLALKMQTPDSKGVVDLTNIFQRIEDREEWIQAWDAYRALFVQACKNQGLNPSQILCIQRVQQGEIGGARLLAWKDSSPKEIDLHHRFLLNWISRFGLTANLIELDRWFSPLDAQVLERNFHTPFQKFLRMSKEDFVLYLNSFEQNWKSEHVQKTFMLKGALQALKGLFSELSQEKWEEIIYCPTRSSVARLSILKIKEQLKLLRDEKEGTLFFDSMSHIEQIYANLAALLEIFSPFSFDDFSQSYRERLTSIPAPLKPLAFYGVHASGMTSLAGILKAVERSLGRAPRILYGENTYFECIIAAELAGKTSSIEAAADEDWKEVDLILGQFNPVLKRIDFHTTEYKVEKIAEALRKALSARRGKFLTLAIDGTLDFINSPRMTTLIQEFQKEIEAGSLNIICYRSGLKFDVFGMDNYCGAPFYMIHNQEEKWAAFDLLLTDPVLQTDCLSLNWFCLAYKYAAPQLELYRKQIFENTRALLNKMPSQLFHDKSTGYRVVPVESGADPAFIDIKISGPLHEFRGAGLVGGGLFARCLEGGHPIFVRASLGFSHPNFSILFAEETTTIRLTLGLDPAQVELLADFFERIDALNGSFRQILQAKTKKDP